MAMQTKAVVNLKVVIKYRGSRTIKSNVSNSMINVYNFAENI